MSMSQFSPFNTTPLVKAPAGPSEELVATVPDLHFGVVPLLNGVSEVNYIESFTNSRKRNRSDSGCSLSDFDISGDEDFTFSNLKRPCSDISSSICTPFAFPPTKEFSLELDAVFQFGSEVVTSGPGFPITSGAITTQSSPQSFSDYPLRPKIRCVFPGMETAELPCNPYKHDLMLNRDQDCKLVITEHPEEVRQTVL